MRLCLPLMVLASLVACSKAPPNRSEGDHESAPYAVEEASRSDVADVAAPGIAPTAAPGVAFSYRYAFRLPAQKIAAVQEQHAQACEKLGISRCRITGMRYRLVNQRDIEAMLAFKLDPMIARQFGKTGIEAVTGSEGMLVDSEISGVDAGAAIKTANRNAADLGDELKKVEEQLARPGLPSAERVNLQSRAEELRQSIRANSANRQEQEESLATTPMVFHYGSGDLVPGFDTNSPIRAALKSAGENFVGGVAILFLIVITLLPWLIVGALAWWLFKWGRRRFRPTAVPPVEADAPE